MKKIIYGYLLLHSILLLCSEVDQDDLSRRSSYSDSEGVPFTQEILDEYSKEEVGELFIIAAYSGDVDTISLIMQSPKFHDLDESFIQRGLLAAIRMPGNDIVPVILSSGRIHDITLDSLKIEQENLSEVERLVSSDLSGLVDSNILGQSFVDAASHGYIDVVKLFMNSSSYNDIPADYIGRALISAIKNGHEDVAEIIIRYEVGFNEIDSDFLMKAFEVAIEKNSEKNVRMILQSKRHKEVFFGIVSGKVKLTQKIVDLLSKQYLEELFIKASRGFNLDEMSLIIHSPKFQDIDESVIQNELIYSMLRPNNAIVQMILNTGRIQDIKLNFVKTEYEESMNLTDFDILGHSFLLAVYNGYADVVKLFINSSSFKDIKAIFLEEALVSASEKGNEDIAEIIIHNEIIFNKIDIYFLEWALQNAVYKGNEKIVRMILQSKRLKEISANFLTSCLNAALHKYIGIANWIRAYTALKSEIKPDNLTQLDRQMYHAYQEFLNGNPNDLRNLVFPIGKKGTSRIYAVSPHENSETQAFKKIDSSLLKLFKRDHIKPLLFALVDKEVQKDIALEHIEQMGLTKKEVAATKIQSAFRGHKTRETIQKNKEDLAARKIQSSFRDHRARAAIKNKKA